MGQSEIELGKGKEMRSRKIAVRLALLSVMSITMALMTGCAFGDRHLTLNPVYMDKVPSVTTAKSKVQVVPPVDKRTEQKANLVGYVRNGYGMHTADVLADNSIAEWVQSCIAENLKNAGFKVNNGEINPFGLCVATSIRTLECDSGMSLKATVALDIELKEKNVPFFSRTFVGKASKVNWAASSEEFRATLTNAMQDCLNQAMPVLVKELEGR